MNLENVTTDPATHAHLSRTDCQGEFVSRYSDDGGATWSPRVVVPYRRTPIDYGNEWNGTLKLFWTVDQTKIRDRIAYFAFTKIGKWLLGPPEELWFLQSSNVLTEANLSNVVWALGPEGDHGLPPPFLPPGDRSSTIEEGHLLPLVASPGFVMIGRTTMGYLAAAQTRAPASTTASGWGPTGYAQYYDPGHGFPLSPLNASASAFGGAHAGLKNPRGPITAKYFPSTSGVSSGNRWLLLYYNNNGRSYDLSARSVEATEASQSRNPYWLCGGVEARGTILWSQPDIVIFGREMTAPGYPDFIQGVDGSIFITETQKTVARVHKIPADLLASLWSQPSVNVTAPGYTQVL